MLPHTFYPRRDWQSSALQRQLPRRRRPKVEGELHLYYLDRYLFSGVTLGEKSGYL